MARISKVRRIRSAGAWAAHNQDDPPPPTGSVLLTDEEGNCLVDPEGNLIAEG